VEVLRERFGVSERRACAVVGIHRSTMHLTPPPVTAEEAELRAWLRRFATDRPRWGWRRAAKMARRAGWKVNNKRIRRLWREEGLRVPQRRKKKRLTGIGVAVGAMSPIRPNVIWAMDFQFDTTADGRTLKMLNVIDEFTREALAIEVNRSIDADGVVDALDRHALDRLAANAEHRSTCASTTAPNSWPTPSTTGAGSTAPGRCSSTPAHHGRTPRSSRSTAACATKCSTRGASTRSWKPA
jgi:transposase InsO family protein